jgi:hypothetical protein
MISFHRIISLLSSLLNQLCHLSLKLEADTYVCGSMIISGDIIQQLCIDRLKPMATYSLNLLLYVKNDSKEKIIFNSFCQVEFIQREKPRVVLQECYESDISRDTHCFVVFTLPYNDTTLFSYMFSNDFKKYIENISKTTQINILLFFYLDLVKSRLMQQICFHVLINCLFMVIRRRMVFESLSNLDLLYHHFLGHS